MTASAALPVCDARHVTVLPNHPVVVRGFQPEVSCRNLGELLAASGTPVVHGYLANGGESWVEMPAADAVAAFSAGQLPINVVDLPIGPDIDPDDRLTAPALMSHGNLLLLRLRSRYGEYRRLDRIPLAFSFAYHPIQTARFVLRYLQGWEA